MFCASCPKYHAVTQECRAQPPRLVVIENRPVLVRLTEWPRVIADEDWCGEHPKRRATP